MLTLNLLPPQEIITMRMVRLRIFILQRIIILTVLGLLLLSLFIAADFFLRHNLGLINQDIASKKTEMASSGFTDFEQKINQFNKVLSNASEVQNLHLRLSPALIEITRLTSSNIKYTYLHINSDDQSVELRGVAAYREDLLSLQENLQKSEWVANLDSPLSNLVSERNVDFTLHFKLVKDFIK